MRSVQNKYTEATKKKTAKKKEGSVLKNVVSLRVNDQEKRLLDRLTRSTSQSVSDLVREAIGFWLSKHQKAFSQTKTSAPALLMES